MAPGLAKVHRGGPSNLVQPVGRHNKSRFGTFGISAAGILFPQCLLRLSLEHSSNGIRKNYGSHMVLPWVFYCQISYGGSIEVALDLESQCHHLALCFISTLPGEYDGQGRFLLVGLTQLGVSSFLFRLLLTIPVIRFLARLFPV